MKKNVQNKTIFILLTTILIEMIGVGILIPIIPFLFTDSQSSVFILKSATEISSKGYILLGLLLAAYPLAQFFATPFIGSLSDRYGRKPLLISSIFGSFLSRFMFGLSVLTGNILLLFVARIIDGITGGNISVAQSAIGDISTEENRSKRFAYVGAMIGLGFILGPLLGGLLSNQNDNLGGSAFPFFLAGALSLISGLINIFFFKETLDKKSTFITTSSISLIASVKKGFTHKSFRPILISSTLFFSGFAFYTSFFNVFMIERFSFTEREIGLFFAYVGSIIFIAQGFIITKVSPRVTSESLLRFSLLACGLAITLNYFATSWKIIALITPIFGISNAISSIELTTLASKKSLEIGQGVGMGIFTSVNALGQALPPLIAGFLAQSIQPSIPILIGGLLCIISGIYFNFFNCNVSNY